MYKPKHAVFAKSGRKVELVRYGKVVVELTERGGSFEHQYPTVAAAKAAMEQARVSGMIV